jgi:hypothetical protein
MCDVTEIIEELQAYGVPKGRAHALVAQLIMVGEDAAVLQKEAPAKVVEWMLQRQRVRR